MSDFTLRELDDTLDQEFLMRIHEDVSKRLYEGVAMGEEQQRIMNEIQLRAQSQAFRKSFPNGRYSIIETEGGPVGQWYVDENDTRFELFHAALLSECQGKGIVASLLRDLSQRSVKANKQLLACVDKMNPAKEIWFHLGFRAVEDLGSHFRIEWFAPNDPAGAAPPGVMLRRYHSNDDAFLFELFKESRSSTFSSMGLATEQLDVLMRQQFDSCYRQWRAEYPEANQYVVVDSGEAIGEWYVNEGEESFYIVNATLLPAYRGRGISAAFHRHLFNQSRRAGKPVRSHVAKGNPVKEILNHLGLKVVGDTGAYYELEFRGDR